MSVYDFLALNPWAWFGLYAAAVVAVVGFVCLIRRIDRG